MQYLCITNNSGKAKRRPKAISPSSKLFGGAPRCGMRGLTPNNSIMPFNTFDSKKAGSRKLTSEPRRVGQVIIDDILFSNEHPLGVAYRQRKLFKDLFPDTHLDVDLKVLTCEPERMPIGKLLVGTLFRNDETTFKFIENTQVKTKVTTVRRNPVIYSGGCINVHKLADGTLRLEFNRPRFYPDFSFRDFCLAAAQELLTIARL